MQESILKEFYQNLKDLSRISDFKECNILCNQKIKSIFQKSYFKQQKVSQCLLISSYLYQRTFYLLFPPSETPQTENEETKEKYKNLKTKHKLTETESEVFDSCENGNLENVQNSFKKFRSKSIKYILDNNGFSILHYAAENGHLNIVKYLIEDQRMHPDIRGEYDRTPLHYACLKGHFPIVEYLLSKGADIEAKDSLNGWTPLFFSYFKGGHCDIGSFLISKNANTSIIDNSGRSINNLR